ncbi:MAG: hypothetical protein ABJD97_05985 [Betaproteobacteria bacterium]
MNAMHRKTGVPAVAVLISGLVLAACGDGPAPNEVAAAVAGDAAAIQRGSTAAIARTPVASAERDAAAPTRIARAPDATPGGACPAPVDEPAPIDGGREITQGPEPEAAVEELAPAPGPRE